MVEFVLDILPDSLKSCKKRSKKPVSNATQKASANSNDWPEDQGHRQQQKHRNLQDKTEPLGSTIANENRIKLQEQKQIWTSIEAYVYIPCHTIVSVQEMSNPKTNDHSWITDHNNSQGDWTNYRSCVQKRILATQTHKT